MLLREYREFTSTLSTISIEKISAAARKFLMEVVVRLAFKAVLDGASKIKKISAEGIGQLILDVKSLQIGLEGICQSAQCPLKPLPLASTTVEFVKALYCKEEELEAFLKHSKEIEPKYLTAIVNIVMYNSQNKKLKQRLTTVVDELVRNYH